MAAFAVVEGFEVIEDGRGGGGFGGEGCAVMEDLGLEGGAGAFREGVVGAVTGGAHALAEVVAGEARAGGGGGGWAAAIGRAAGTWRDDAGIESAAQGLGDHLGVEGVGEFPAEDGAAEEIEDGGEVMPAFAGRDAGIERSEIACRRQPAGQRRRALANVAEEVSARSLGWRSLGEEIGRRMRGVIWTRGLGLERLSGPRAQAVGTHEAGDAIFCAGEAGERPGRCRWRVIRGLPQQRV